MIRIDAKDLARWADSPDARHQLPELIRRLIRATGGDSIDHCEIPSGSGVDLPGWDGLIESSSASEFVPQGLSGWEMSTEKGVAKKASKDLVKRTENPLGLNPVAATFVFATPRIWRDKQDWLADQGENETWSAIRVLDAHNLSDWLDEAPAVAAWFSSQIGLLPPSGWVDLESWWRNWTGGLRELTPDLLMAGRENAVVRVREWCSSNDERLVIEGDSRQEALAFFFASMHSAEPQMRDLIFSRALVITQSDAAVTLRSSPLDLLVIDDVRSGEQSAPWAFGKKTLAPRGKGEATNPDITLPRLGYDEALAALTSTGCADIEARRLLRRSGRRLDALRFLVDSSGMLRPQWADSAHRFLLGLSLIGQWNAAYAGDRQLVADLCSAPYEEVEEVITRIAAGPNAPVIAIDDRYLFASPEVAWRLLEPQISPSTIERFTNRAIGALQQLFQHPTSDEERAANFSAQWLALAAGQKFPDYSLDLYKGITNSLAMFGALADGVDVDAGWGTISQTVIARLATTETTASSWRGLAPYLSSLAEAAPDAFLRWIEFALENDPDQFDQLLNEPRHRGLKGGEHTHLTGALLTLAWSAEYFPQAIGLLAHLATLDRGGNRHPRPLNAVQDMLLSWIRFTDATDNIRLGTAKQVLNRHPEIGRAIIPELLSPNRNRVSAPAPPRWQLWGFDGPVSCSPPERSDYLATLVSMMIENANNNAIAWVAIIEYLNEYPHKVVWQIIDALRRQSGTLADHPARQQLRESIRRCVSIHRTFSDAEWVFPDSMLNELEDIGEQLESPDPIEARAEVFTRMRLEILHRAGSYEEGSKQMKTIQNATAKEIYDEGGIPSLCRMAEIADLPETVGSAAAHFLNIDQVTEIAYQYLGSPQKHLDELARGTLWTLRQRDERRWENLLADIRRSERDPDALATMYLLLDPAEDMLDRLQRESHAVQTAYWQRFQSHHFHNMSSEDQRIAIQELLRHRRTDLACDYFASRETDSHLLRILLACLPHDLDDIISEKWLDTVTRYNIGKLFHNLDAADDVSDIQIARLEMPFLVILENQWARETPRQLAAQRLLSKDPGLFAELVARWELSGDDDKQNAFVAYRLLDGLVLPPPVHDDFGFPRGDLTDYITEALAACQSLGVREAGGRFLGRALGRSDEDANGLWPVPAVCRAIETASNLSLDNGVVLGRLNSRGVTIRGIFEGGEQERELEASYREQADAYSAEFQRTAKILREIADHYMQLAAHEDASAEWDDRTMR